MTLSTGPVKTLLYKIMSRFENVFVSSFTWCVYLHKGAQFIRHSNLPFSAQVPFAGKRLHHTCPCLPHLVCTRYTETRYRCNSDLKNLDFWQHGLRPKEEKLNQNTTAVDILEGETRGKTRGKATIMCTASLLIDTYIHFVTY